MKPSMVEKILWKIYCSAENVHDLTLSDLFLTISQPRKAYHQKGYINYLRLKNEFNKAHRKINFSKLIYRLKNSGLIKLDNKRAIILTPKGNHKLLPIILKRTNWPLRKDKKWQMVIFDIPEKYRKTRNKFRVALKILGYQKLQQSIWICPYSTLNETESLIKYYSIGDYAKLLLVEEINL